LSRNLIRLSMDTSPLRETNEAGGISHGLSSGLNAFGNGVWNGLTGVVTEPIKGFASKDSSMIRGMGKGILGVLTKPLTGAMQLVSHTTGGILRSAAPTNFPTQKFPSKHMRPTLPSITKFRKKVLSSDEIYIAHAMGSFISTSRQYPSCVILLSNKRVIIINNSTGELCKSVPIKGINGVKETFLERELITLQANDLQVHFNIWNKYQKASFVQALKFALNQ